MKKFGENLKRVMKEKGITQQRLADLVGVSRSTISKYVTDTAEPSLDVLCDIAIKLGVSCDYLIKGEEKPQKRIEKKVSKLTVPQILQTQDALDLLQDVFH